MTPTPTHPTNNNRATTNRASLNRANDNRANDNRASLNRERGVQSRPESAFAVAVAMSVRSLLLALALALSFSPQALAQSESDSEAAPEENAPPPVPRAGVNYIALEPPQPTRVAAGKIEVIEFLNFSCPHCFRMQGPFAKWRADNKEGLHDVVVVRHPVVFQRYNGHFARLFYTMEALDLGEEFLGKVFNAIHRQRKLLNSRGRALDWLEEEGVDRAKAEAAYDSFGVNVKVRRAEGALESYGVSGTPQFVVAGKYRLEPGVSGSQQRMLALMGELIKIEREEIKRSRVAPEGEAADEGGAESSDKKS